MNFFQQIFDLIDGIDVTMTIKRKNGKLTMSVLPQTASTISPALITGTPDELDEGFFDAIKVPLETAKGLKADLEQYNSSVAAAKEKPAAAPKKEIATAKAKPTAKGKVTAKKAPTVTEASLFEAGSDEATPTEQINQMISEKLTSADHNEGAIDETE